GRRMRSVHSRMGRPWMASRGLGVFSVSGRIRVPFPPARMMPSIAEQSFRLHQVAQVDLRERAQRREEKVAVDRDIGLVFALKAHTEDRLGVAEPEQPPSVLKLHAHAV